MKGYTSKSLIPVSQIRDRDKGTVKIGNTLFIDGTPHVACGNPECMNILRAFDSHKITLGYWKDEEVPIMENGSMVAIEVKRFPVLRQVNGCSTCYDLQSHERLTNGGRLTFFRSHSTPDSRRSTGARA